MSTYTNPHTVTMGGVTVSLWRSPGTDDAIVVQIDTFDSTVTDDDGGMHNHIRVNINDNNVYGPALAVDDRTFTCTGCKRTGTTDDGCEDGEPCPDEACDGTMIQDNQVCVAGVHPDGLWGCDCPDCLYLQQQCRLDDAADDGS